MRRQIHTTGVYAKTRVDMVGRYAMMHHMETTRELGPALSPGGDTAHTDTPGLLFLPVDDSARDLLKRVSHPQVDIEYGLAQDALAPTPRAIRARMPEYVPPKLKGVLASLGARYSYQTKDYKLPPYLCYGIALEETFKEAYLKPDYDASYTEWKDVGVKAWADLRVPQHVRPVWDGHDTACKAPECVRFHGLYAFQKEAVIELVENPFGHPGMLLDLSPGLGKTVVAMTAASILGLERVLIVSPLSLLSVWRWEKAKWFGKGTGASLPAPMRVVHGEGPPPDGWVVTNYNTVTSPRRNADYWEQEWDLIILDESVLVKNRKSQRFANIKNLRNSTQRLWLLSGSPITRHPNDLWAQFHLIEPRAFPSYWRFTRRWCAVEKNVWGTRIVGSASRNLRSDFADILYVKSQEEVLPDLPEMIFQNVNVTLQHQQMKVYDQMVSSFIAELEKAGVVLSAPTVLAQLTRLQQIASNLINLSSSEIFGSARWPDASGKADALMELFDAEAIEMPALVWTHWKPGARALADRLEAAGYNVACISGDMDEEERTQTFLRYKGSGHHNEDADIDVLILQLAVGKFGLTLTNARTIVYMDKTWAADDYVQSLRRVKRIGLTHVPRVISLVAPGTIDDMVEDNLAGKLPDIAHINNNNLAQMLKGLRKYSEIAATGDAA